MKERMGSDQAIVSPALFVKRTLLYAASCCHRHLCDNLPVSQGEAASGTRRRIRGASSGVRLKVGRQGGLR